MTVGKYLLCLKKLNELIEKQNTGTSKQLAQKMGVSQRQLQLDIQDLNRQDVKIAYNKKITSYEYMNGKSILDLFKNNLN